ncbi:uncharacterized protein LOC114355984 [Ostrinia furnacalis]|uniref:uncharacterized protein LOC114355984 n=1 Tax=Ostrinia furnacalis TaxID=93504 RepID=UPI00103E9909|nr:uncharacterized protein LOC114355984 [Ostrinia furnacalis]
MPINKCIVIGCSSTKATARLFSLPRDEALQALATDKDQSNSMLMPDNAKTVDSEPVSCHVQSEPHLLNVEIIAASEGASTRQVDANVSPQAVHRPSSPVTSSTPPPHNTYNTIPGVSRDRIVKNIRNLTPKCRQMYHKCRNIINSNRRLLRSFEENLERATNLSNKDCFKQLIKNLTPQAKLFLMMQVSKSAGLYYKVCY